MGLFFVRVPWCVRRVDIFINFVSEDKMKMTVRVTETNRSTDCVLIFFFFLCSGISTRMPTRHFLLSPSSFALYFSCAWSVEGCCGGAGGWVSRAKIKKKKMKFYQQITEQKTARIFPT